MRVFMCREFPSTFPGWGPWGGGQTWALPLRAHRLGREQPESTGPECVSVLAGVRGRERLGL